MSAIIRLGINARRYAVTKFLSLFTDGEQITFTDGSNEEFTGEG